MHVIAYCHVACRNKAQISLDSTRNQRFRHMVRPLPCRSSNSINQGSFVGPGARPQSLYKSEVPLQRRYQAHTELPVLHAVYQ